MKHERKKPIKSRPAGWLLMCAAGLWLIAGCGPLSSQPLSSPPQSMTQALEVVGNGWWGVRFRMDRPADKTRWERDLLLAHRVAAPLIRTQKGEIDLWRFHRRSAGDGAGHQFSFLFYTSAVTAGRINQMIVEDPMVQRMLSAGIVQEVLTDAIDRNDRPDVGDTSDSKWSPVMRDTWPHYIMGVSRMWLEMIDQVSREIGTVDDLTVDQLLNHYEEVNTEITRIWQQEGYHALLHHLNAIYGYEAMVYWEKRWKSF